MPGFRRTTILLLTLAGFADRPVTAQDTNHWTDQFGNRARLLGGTVVGGIGDLSAAFYNPGALARSDRPEIVISADALEYAKTKVRSELRASRPVSTSRFNWIPSFFGGHLRFNQLGRSRLAYCFLARQDLDTRIEERASLGRLATTPQLDSGGFAVRLQQRISEYWGGVAWARQIGARLGFGISSFVAVRNQRSVQQAFLQGWGAGTAGALSITGRNFDYQHWRLVWKLGLSLPLEQWSLGFALTTPGVALGGGGSTAADRSYIVQAADSTFQRDIGTVHYNNVGAVFRSPMSAALGVSRRLGRGALYATVEWFDAVRSLTVLDAPSGLSEQGVELETDITYALHSVLNAGIGAEFELRDDWRGFTSYHTDRSAAEPTGSNATFSDFDLNHIAAGAIFKALRADVTFGMVYAWGSEKLRRPLLPSLGSGANSVLELEPATVSYRRYTFIFGFNFPFLTAPGEATP